MPAVAKYDYEMRRCGEFVLFLKQPSSYCPYVNYPFKKMDLNLKTLQKKRSKLFVRSFHL